MRTSEPPPPHRRAGGAPGGVRRASVGDRARGRGLPRPALLAAVGLACAAPWASAQNNDPASPPPRQEGPDFELPPPAQPAQPGQRQERARQQQQGAQDGDAQQQEGQAGQAPEAPEPDIRLGPFAEPVELRALLEIAVRELGVQIAADTALAGSVMITQELRIPRSKLLGLINSFLEQNGFALSPGPLPGFYEVRSVATMPVTTDDELATTLIIRTPNSRPSVMQAAVQSQIASAGTAVRISALDELGVLIVTGTPGKVREINELVGTILEERDQQRLIPFDLLHVSAAAAREQVLQYAGVSDQPQAVRDPRQRQGEQGGAVSLGVSLSNLGERLIIAPSGNRLVFRGTPDEADRVAELIDLVDQPNTLEPKRYFTGGATTNIAAFAEQQGLGTRIQFSTVDDAQGQVGQAGRVQQGRQAGDPFDQATQVGGSAIVVDEERGSIVFYGTPQQQERFARLVEEYDPGDEQVVIRSYRLDWARAEDVADLLTELIEGTRRAVDSPLAPDAGQVGGGGAQGGQARRDGGAPEGSVADVQDEDAFVTFDEGNNQVLVRAPQRLQPQFDRLIQTIDRRRPQVFIDAKILAVTWTDDFRLAFESQLVNAAGTGGIFQQNFGLTSGGDGITNPRVVSENLLGFTSAVIKSRYVPFVINALQRQVNGRILASPQLLVDDNTESQIVSVDEQPTTSTSQGDATTETSFAGFEEAGTDLTVTPRINPGGFVTIGYNVIFSNFVGQGTDGIPAPRQRREVASDAVTIPSDSTIVVGGITVEDIADTRVTIPFLGDIPLLGLLFSDTNQNDSKTTLYVFITPTVLYEPTISDYELLTEGARDLAEIDPDLPELETFMVRVMMPEELAGTARDQSAEP